MEITFRDGIDPSISITRYLGKAYAEQVVEEGKFRFSGFESFRKDSHDQRGDPTEGQWVMRVHYPGGDFQFLGMYGGEAYVMSAVVGEVRDVQTAFGYDGAFRVRGLVGFVEAIGARIPGCYAALVGSCEYRDGIIEKEYAYPPPEPTPENAASHMQLMAEWQWRVNGGDSFFLKPSRYINQHEVRIVWLAHGRAKPYCCVRSRLAARYCQLV